MSDRAKAIVVGVGPEAGLGGALCKRLRARRACTSSWPDGRPRRSRRWPPRSAAPAAARPAWPTDTTSETRRDRALRSRRDGRRRRRSTSSSTTPATPRWGSCTTWTRRFFEQVWRVGCFGGFLVGREAVRRMLPRGRGTVIFTGATASMRGKPDTTAFAAAKAGLRSLAQSMARAYGPQGIHVAHVVVDGGIAGDKIVQGLPQFARGDGRGRPRQPRRASPTPTGTSTSSRGGLDARARPAHVQGVVLAMAAKVCVVAGVGPGTGAALSRRFAAGGYRVAMLARDARAPRRARARDRGQPRLRRRRHRRGRRAGRRRRASRRARARRACSSTTPSAATSASSSTSTPEALERDVPHQRRCR